MNITSTQLNANTPEPEKHKRRKWLILLLLLFVFMMITTGMVGFILGRSSRFSDGLNGKAIDTIHIAEPEDKVKIHLAGKILYSDGTPYVNGNVQLHSEPKQTATDEKGAFIFKNADVGSHTLSIIDDKGTVLAERKLNINPQETAEDAKIKLLDSDEYEVAIAVNIKYLEVQVEINKEDGKLYINPDKVTYLTEDGIVVSPTGKADIKNGVVVTPVGNVITTDGTIICGSGENDNRKVIIPSGDLKEKDDGSIVTADGTQVRPDGTVVNNNTVIDTEGVSVTEDGKVKQPGDGGYQIVKQKEDVKQVPLGKDTESLINNIGNQNPDTTVQPEGNISENNNPDTNPRKPASPEDNTSDHTPGTGTSENGSPGTNVPDDNASGINPPETQTPGTDTPGTNTPGTNTPGTNTPGTDIPNDPTDNGLTAEKGTSADKMALWEQNTTIDLFYNRTAGTEDKNLIAPGSKGYYLFRLSNDNHFPISFHLGISENDLHLPLEFAIADGKGSLLTSWAAANGNKEISTEKLDLEKRGRQLYQIKWRWPYENGEAQDKQDTRAAESEDRTYTVNLVIRAEQQ